MMKCPTCDVRLIETERLGAKSLTCPECCGEWVSQGLMFRLVRVGLNRTVGPDRPARRLVETGNSGRGDLFDWF